MEKVGVSSGCFWAAAVHARESRVPQWYARHVVLLFSQLHLFRIGERGASHRRAYVTSTHQHWCARSFLGLAGRDDHFFVETFFSRSRVTGLICALIALASLVCASRSCAVVSPLIKHIHFSHTLTRR